MYDEETEIYYLNARYYDPKIARFLTEDTFRGVKNDPLSLNLYTYCHNEPIMYIDPDGHWEKGDSKRKAAEQAQILEATKEYISAKQKGDKKGMADAHRKAEDARVGKVYKAGNITSSSIEKALKEISSSKYVYKSAKDDVKKSTMASVVRDVSTKNPYRAQIERGQAQTISAINNMRKDSHVLDPAKAPRGTIGLGGNTASTTVKQGTGNGTTNDQPVKLLGFIDYYPNNMPTLKEFLFTPASEMMGTNGNADAITSATISPGDAASEIIEVGAIALVGALIDGIPEAKVDSAGTGSTRTLPKQRVIKENGVIIEHYYPDDHGNPAHLHVKGGGGSTKIGPQGFPTKGQPELSPKQAKVVEENLDVIKKTLKQVQKWMKSRK